GNAELVHLRPSWRALELACRIQERRARRARGGDCGAIAIRGVGIEFRPHAVLTQRSRRMKKISLILLAAALLSGCAHLGVEPWQRDVLARPEMSLDADPLAAALD